VTWAQVAMEKFSFEATREELRRWGRP